MQDQNRPLFLYFRQIDGQYPVRLLPVTKSILKYLPLQHPLTDICESLPMPLVLGGMKRLELRKPNPSLGQPLEDYPGSSGRPQGVASTRVPLSRPLHLCFSKGCRRGGEHGYGPA